MRTLVKILSVVSVMLAAALWTQQAIAVPDLDLPSEAGIRTSWNGVVSLLNVELSGFPPGDYDISEGTYVGWCVDLEGKIDFTGGTYYYPVTLWSTYDPNIPVVPNPNPGPPPTSETVYKPGNWNMINYMINQGDRYSPSAIQFAIWYFVNGLWWDDIAATPGAPELIIEADQNRGFEPQQGDVMGVLCHHEDTTEENFQDVLIEVNVPVPEASTLLLFGSGLSGLLFFARKKGLIKL